MDEERVSKGHKFGESPIFNNKGLIFITKLQNAVGKSLDGLDLGVHQQKLKHCGDRD